MFGSSLRTALGSRESSASPPVSDPTFANVVFLVSNGDGSEGGTDMVDKSTTPHTLTYRSNAQMDTGVPLFDNPTILLDGVNDAVTTPDHNDFALLEQDFTIQAWVYPTDIAGGTRSIISHYRGFGDDREWIFQVSTSGFPSMLASPNGQTFNTFTSTIALIQNSWNFAVAQRENDIWTLWVNGFRGLDPVTNDFTVHNGAGPMCLIGGRQGSSDQNDIQNEWKGNIGPLRLTVGEAVYPGNPTAIGVPSTPFPEA